MSGTNSNIGIRNIWFVLAAVAATFCLVLLVAPVINNYGELHLTAQNWTTSTWLVWAGGVTALAVIALIFWMLYTPEGILPKDSLERPSSFVDFALVVVFVGGCLLTFILGLW